MATFGGPDGSERDNPEARPTMYDARRRCSFCGLPGGGRGSERPLVGGSARTAICLACAEAAVAILDGSFHAENFGGESQSTLDRDARD